MKLSRLKRPKALWWRMANPAGMAPNIRKRIRPRSARRERLMAEYRREREIFLLEHPKCEMPGCLSPAREVHHKRGRIGPLLLLKQFWAAMCAAHHRWIGEHPQEARELCLLANEGEWNTVPRE